MFVSGSGALSLSIIRGNVDDLPVGVRRYSMSNKRFHLHIILFGILLIGTLALAACSRSESPSEYKTLTVKNHIANFSLEYRAYYNDLDGPHIVDSTTDRFTAVDILAPKTYETMGNPEPGGGGIVDMTYVPAHINIRASDVTKNPERPAAVRINDSISGWGKWPHFQLLERSNVTVSGVQAELIAYQVDGFFVGPDLEYCTKLSFDYNGLQWDIESEAGINMSAMIRADFDHVVETFKILE